MNMNATAARKQWRGKSGIMGFVLETTIGEAIDFRHLQGMAARSLQQTGIV